MIYYHGSGSVFNEFSKKRIGQNHWESENSGFFFTKSKLLAQVFAGEGFLYEVKLTVLNPVREKTNSELYTPADHYDLHTFELLNEAYLDKKDGIFIQGTNNDDLMVVFEPHQIEILKITQKGVELEIPGLSSENVNVKPFHYDVYEEELSHCVSSLEFGSCLDGKAKAALKDSPAYANGKGVFFGKGKSFAKKVLLSFCGVNLDSDQINKCRDDCLVIYDFDEELTMVRDLRGESSNLDELMKRPLIDTPSIRKTFSPPDNKKHTSRVLGLYVGPQKLVSEIINDIPDYALGFTTIDYLSDDAPTNRCIPKIQITSISFGK